MIGCLVFNIIPFCIVLRHSVTQGYGQSSSFVGLEHYVRIFENKMFSLAFANTMRFLAV